VQELRKAWETGSDGKGGKDGWQAAEIALTKAFDQTVANGQFGEVEQFVEVKVKAAPLDTFVSELQTRLVVELISRSDRLELVKVLAWGSTDYSTMWCIEDALTSDEPWNKLSDGLAVLFDAYDLAESFDAKDANYFAAWRALGDLPIKTQDQNEYMRVARPWYQSNRAHLLKQRRYDHSDFVYGPRGTQPRDSRKHLFTIAKPVDR